MTRLAIVVLAMTIGAGSLLAQGPPAGGRGGARQAGPPPTPRAQQPFDLTGQWVSVVTEDWRWRMVTPQKGDYGSLPLTPAARTAADAWDLQKDIAAGEQCKAFGAAAIMRLPLRVRISWQDDTTLKIETDSGQQTRLLRFAAPGPAPVATAAAAPAERTWQGVSTAEWFKQAQARGFGGGGGRGVVGGNLRVTTRQLRPGYLRKNGVPYSENAVVTEYYNRHDEPNGDSWFTVTTVVDDPRNLNQPFITSSHFKKETDQSKWAPTPCVVDPPR